MSYDETRVETPRPKPRKASRTSAKRQGITWPLIIVFGYVVYCVSIVTLDSVITIIEYIDRHL